MSVGSVNVTVGELNKVGAPVNGKQVYEIKDEKQSKKITYIVPQENADKFEKLYGEMDVALQNIAQTSQDALQQQGLDFAKKLKNITIIGTITGAVIPAAIAIFSKGKVWKRSVFGALSSIAGAALGAFGSTYLGVKLSMKNILKADNNLQKINDISKQVESLGVESKQEDIIA